MATQQFTAKNFEQAVSDGIVLVDFWASWCQPCRAFGPTYEKASEQHPDVVFGKVDTEAEQTLAGALQVTSIPTVMAFRDGIRVFAQPGALARAALEQVITAVKDLDMEDVRAQLTNQAGGRDQAAAGEQ